MKKLVFLLLASMVATSAFAVIDPDPNMCGVYFDTNADINCATQNPGTPFMAYFIATNTTANGIDAYEFGLNVEVPVGSSYFFLSNSPAGNGIDVGQKDASGNGDYIVGLADAIPSSPAVVLHSWNVFLSGVFPMQWFITESSLTSIPGTTPVMQNAGTGELFQAGQSTGGPDVPVAVVNDASFCPVGVEETSFGSVKSLFR